jgi:hypothetical protein
MILCPSRQAGIGGRGAPGAAKELRRLNDLTKRTLDSPTSAVEHVRINHRRGNVLVSEQASRTRRARSAGGGQAEQTARAKRFDPADSGHPDLRG